MEETLHDLLIFLWMNGGALGFRCGGLKRPLCFLPYIDSLCKSLFVSSVSHGVLGADVHICIGRLISKPGNGDTKVVFSNTATFSRA